MDGRARDNEKLYEAGVRFDSTIHVVTPPASRRKASCPVKARRRSRARNRAASGPSSASCPSRPPRRCSRRRPRAPAPAEPDDDWRARAVGLYAQGPVRLTDGGLLGNSAALRRRGRRAARVGRRDRGSGRGVVTRCARVSGAWRRGRSEPTRLPFSALRHASLPLEATSPSSSMP